MGSVISAVWKVPSRRNIVYATAKAPYSVGVSQRASRMFKIKLEVAKSPWSITAQKPLPTQRVIVEFLDVVQLMKAVMLIMLAFGIMSFLRIIGDVDAERV
jgi:hypothetical protein